MVEIDIYKFGRVVAKAMVDDQEAYLGESSYLGNTHWRHDTGGYALRLSGPQSNRKTHLLHREIMGNPSGMEVDHINGDKLDCRHVNLRITGHGANSQNRKGSNKNSSTGVRGVFLQPSGKWRSMVRYQGKLYCVGRFDTIEEAERAVIAKRREFGFLTGAEDPAASPAAS